MLYFLYTLVPTKTLKNPVTPQHPLQQECSQTHYHCYKPSYLYYFAYYIVIITEVNIFCKSFQQFLLHDGE